MRKVIKELIYKDLYRITGQKSKLLYIKNLFNPEFCYIRTFRKCNYNIENSKNKIRIAFNRMMLKKSSIKYGYEIEPGCTIGEGFRLVHRGAVAINPGAIIGKNVTVFKGVTIGSSRRGKHEGTPIIKDNVWIGSNSSVIGGITIGEDVMIAPNSFVNINIPPHSLCIGSPAKIIPRECATRGYIDNPIK